ncbi:hypothetical protein Tco_0378238 [Tanacetum coccineum]
MERGFLSQKGDGGGRGVKEKNGVAPSAKEKNEAVKDGVAPSITVASGNNIGTQEANSVKAGHDNLHGENVRETPINFTANPNKGTSYANLFTRESSKKSVNFRTLITPMGNGIDVAVPVESIRVISKRSSYVRAMIELRADMEFKDTIVVAMLKLVGEGFYTCTIRVKYEWKPLRCACCKVFGYIQDECPKNLGLDVAKKSKIPSQAPRGVPVGPKVGFKPVKQLYRAVSKKNNVNTSSNKKKDVESTKEFSNPNPFDVFNSVKNDVDLGTNGGTSNLASKEANSSGSSFWNVGSSIIITTPIVEKINKSEKLIIDKKITLVDDEGKPLKKVDYPGDHDSEDEVALVDIEMANFLASERVGYGTNSLLEQ